MEYFAGLDVAVEETSICVIGWQSYGDRRADDLLAMACYGRA
ncbi:hypothetical protein [Bradyrhizobium genosp. P]